VRKIQHFSDISEQLLSRRVLAQRWSCCVETIKRREREGLLRPVRFNQRLLRYRLSEIISIEASGGAPMTLSPKVGFR